MLPSDEELQKDFVTALFSENNVKEQDRDMVKDLPPPPWQNVAAAGPSRNFGL